MAAARYCSMITLGSSMGVAFTKEPLARKFRAHTRSSFTHRHVSWDARQEPELATKGFLCRGCIYRLSRGYLFWCFRVAETTHLEERRVSRVFDTSGRYERTMPQLSKDEASFLMDSICDLLPSLSLFLIPDTRSVRTFSPRMNRVRRFSSIMLQN